MAHQRTNSWKSVLERFIDWLFFLVGLPLVLIGGGLMAAVVDSLLSGASESSTGTKAIIFVVLGLLPFVAGIWLCRSPFEKKKAQPESKSSD